MRAFCMTLSMRLTSPPQQEPDETTANCHAGQFAIHTVQLPKPSEEGAPPPWLDLTTDYSRQWLKTYGQCANGDENNRATYYTLQESGQRGLAQATDELHRMFLVR